MNYDQLFDISLLEYGVYGAALVGIVVLVVVVIQALKAE